VEDIDMKLVTFSHAGATRVGIVLGETVVDLAQAAPQLPSDMRALLTAGRPALEAAAAASESSAHRIALSKVRLEAPVRPGKCLAIGLNYADHIAETRRQKPDFPTFFNKQVTCINGPSDPIHLPRVSGALDYEGELAFVIGTRCRHVPRQRAAHVIAGFTVMNDVSVRDWQAKAPTLTLGKSFDTHGPLGPWIVTPDEVGDPHALDLRTWVNGELRQSANTRHLIFDCYDQIETLSTVMTLEPGDVISTGPPAGVGIAHQPPRMLREGDVVTIEIERVGRIENRVVAEPAETACP
jgi:2-keto-4-pentenoate hydratase/2-oxohepta-3-ene-1,7-dioic acid hydratase in catechol pathway